MYWNHRVVNRVVNPGTPHESAVLFIVEVYYDNDSHHIIGWTEKEAVFGETVDELRQSLHWMLDALDKPVLDEAELLVQSQIARQESVDDFFSEGENSQRLTMEEVLDSLGLEAEDVEPPRRKTTFDTDEYGSENLGF